MHKWLHKWLYSHLHHTSRETRLFGRTRKNRKNMEKCRIRKRSACPVSARSSPAESEATLVICSDGNENRGNHGAVSGKPQALSLTTPPAVGRALTRKCGSTTECTDCSELWTRPASPGRGKPTPTKPRQVVRSIVSDCDRWTPRREDLVDATSSGMPEKSWCQS